MQSRGCFNEISQAGVAAQPLSLPGPDGSVARGGLRPGCAACCTDRVYLTGLEGDLLRRELARQGRLGLLARLEPGPKPAYTCNQLARLCIEGQEPPEEVASGQGAACALLEDGRCGVYEARPLACRVMASRVRCREGGGAQGDPWWFTLDTALMQIAEHIDLGGMYGSLGTVLRREDPLKGEDCSAASPCPAWWPRRNTRLACSKPWGHCSQPRWMGVPWVSGWT